MVVATGAGEPDRLSELIALLARDELAPDQARELATAIHRIVFPICLDRLGDPDAARDAEQEVWQRLLAHVKRRAVASAPIVNGTAYVRQIARNVCNDLGRRATERRREVPVDDLDELPDAADLDAAVSVTAAHGPLARDLSRRFGYRSRRLVAELAGLSEQERTVLCLRREGRSYGEIAALLGGGLTQSTAQTQGERAMHHLRGRVHVTAWRQEAPADWAMPRCPQLAELKAEVRRRLEGNAPLTATLFRDIGRHLDPDPNRRGGTAHAACQLCRDERRRSEFTYWWLLATLPPLLAAPDPPPPRLTSSATADATPVPTAAPTDNQRRRARLAVTLLLVLLAAAALYIAVGKAVTDRPEPSTAAGLRATNPASPNAPTDPALPSDPAAPEASLTGTPDATGPSQPPPTRTTQSGAPVEPATAALAVSPVTGTVPLTVTADGSDSTGVTAHRFDWGDGASTNGAAAIATHTYTTAGTYRLTLVATGKDGRSATRTRTVTALPALTAPALTHPAPNADLATNGGYDQTFTWNPVPGASTYKVEVVCDVSGSFCAPDGGGTSPVVTGTSCVRHVNIGQWRWRVTATSANGNQGPPSDWRIMFIHYP